MHWQCTPRQQLMAIVRNTRHSYMQLMCCMVCTLVLPFLDSCCVHQGSSSWPLSGAYKDSELLVVVSSTYHHVLHWQCTALYCLRVARYPRDQKRLDLLNRLDLLQPGATTTSSSSNGSSSGLQGGAAQQFITPTFVRGAWLDQEATPLHEVRHCCCLCF